MVSVRRVMFGKRTAFTLVELLVAIGIIGFMAGMVVFTMAGAQTDAKIARTEATIQKLNTIIMEKWESYRYRAVDLGVGHTYYRRDQTTGLAPIKARLAAEFRMYKLRDIMRMEMPDNGFDVASGVIFTMTLSGGGTINVPAADTQIAQVMRNSLGSTATNTENYRAECLYAIVANTTINGVPAIELFKPSEIGDTDTSPDGRPEFIDAWGNPIGFIRWPVAFDSELQATYQSVPDAFDPLQLDGNWAGAGTTPGSFPWTVVPLVFSAGPDGAFGMSPDAFDFKDSANRFSPFGASISANTVGMIDTPTAAADNITNHDLMVRQY